MRYTIDGSSGRERLAIDYLPLYTYAACLAEFHPVYGLEWLGEDPPPPPRGLSVRLPELGYERTLSFAGLSDSRRGGRAPLPRGVSNRLEGLARARAGKLHVVMEEEVLARVPISLLPLSEWPHLPEARILAAAHVLPGDDAVFRTVVEAAASLSSTSQARSLPGVIRSGSEAAVEQVLAALYGHLATALEIRYEDPKVQRDATTELTYQTVRTPQDIVGAASTRRGKGNCLDLSLFLAGCLESLGQSPLVFFTGTKDESPAHSFVGCWTDPGRRFRPLLQDRTSLQAKLDQGELIALEATGVCTKERRLSFEDARKKAKEHLVRNESIHALDISAVRPPHGDVRPLDLANAPAVQQAFWAAEELRDRLSARARETLHVLFGLCAADGEILRRIVKRSGGDLARVCEVIETSLPREGHVGPREETNNYRVCMETSKLNARWRDSTSVEEIDVLWAVLENPSRNVRKALEAAGCDYAAMRAELNRKWQRPRQATVSRFFDPS